MDAQLVALLTETVTVAQVTARDRYGAETIGTPITLACRIDPQDRIVRGAPRSGAGGGEEHRSDTRIVFAPTTGVTPNTDSRYLLPGETRRRAPLRTFAPRTERGEVDHYEVWL